MIISSSSVCVSPWFGLVLLHQSCLLQKPSLLVLIQPLLPWICSMGSGKLFILTNNFHSLRWSAFTGVVTPFVHWLSGWIYRDWLERRKWEYLEKKIRSCSLGISRMWGWQTQRPLSAACTQQLDERMSIVKFNSHTILTVQSLSSCFYTENVHK